MGLLNEVMGDTDYGTKVAENDRWILWQNSSTKLYEKRLNEYDQDGYTVQGKYFVVFAESKTGERNTYLALEKGSQKPFMDWSTPQEFDLKLILVLDDMKKDSDIVNIAKQFKKKKKKVKK